MEQVKNSVLGQCPKCKKRNLEYGSSEPCEESYFYEVSCKNCGWEGQEWYSLKFDCYYERKEL